MKNKVVIVGCGKIAGLFDDKDGSHVSYSHAQAYLNHGYFELVGCVDSSAKRAADFSSKYSIPCFGIDLYDVLEATTADVVSITTPDETHCQVALEVLQYRPAIRLVFLEKPACKTNEELEQLLHATKITNIPVVVNHSRRFHPLYKKIKKKYESEFFGELVRVDCHYYGGWIHNGIHLVDLMRFLFSSEFDNFQVIELLENCLVQDPTLTVRAEFGPKKIPIHFHGWIDKYYQVFDVEFRFTKGRLQVNNFESQVIWEKKVINHLGEAVLKHSDDKLCVEGDSSISSAIYVIAEYLDEEERAILDGVQLTDIRPTMNSLWKAAQLTE